MTKFKLTGKPVSDELTDVLLRLEKGTYVPIEDIENTPEIRLARSCINNSIATNKLSGRDDLQDHILDMLQETGSATIDLNDRIQYNGDVKKDSRLDIVIGLPASGKSSAVVDVISQEFQSRIIDNDEAKKLIPEYNNGWGAGIVHEEAQKISERQLQLSIFNHENIVLPKVGSNADKMIKIINLAKKLDYEVNVHFVDLDREKALGRMLNRFVEDGRFLDPQLIDKYCNNIDGNKISRCYETLKKGGILNGYSKWNNDVKRGERPILIEAECKGEFIRNARTSGNMSNHIRDDGGVRNERSRSISGYGGKFGIMENTEQQRSHGKNQYDSQSGGKSYEKVTKKGILSKLSRYKENIKNDNYKKRCLIENSEEVYGNSNKNNKLPER